MKKILLITAIVGIALAGCKKEKEPNEVFYTVTFDTDGGTIVQSQTVEKGGTLNEPNEPTKQGSSFDGWYSEAAFTNKVNFPYLVTADITLYAKWTGENGGGNTGERGQGLYIGGSMTPVNLSSTIGNDILAKAITYIANGANNTIYSLVIDENINNYSGSQGFSKENITLTITSKEPRTISSTTSRIILTVSGTCKLIISGKIIIEGTPAGTGTPQPIISTSSGGTLVLEEDAILRGNIGAGVNVTSGGIFIMDGGSITGNVNPSGFGGGVYVMHAGSTFTMKGGSITDNHAPEGGGVQVYSGTFIMESGWIGNNSALNSGSVVKGITIIASGGYGGGVNVSGSSTATGKFTMKGGTIYGNNTAEARRNTAISGGAALYKWANGIAEYGNGANIVGTASGGINNTLTGINE